MNPHDQSAAFIAWLHDKGYQFVGQTSFYRLMIPELRILQAGYEVQNQLREDEQNGVTQNDRANLKDFDDKIRNTESVGAESSDPDERETTTVSGMH